MTDHAAMLKDMDIEMAEELSKEFGTPKVVPLTAKTRTPVTCPEDDKEGMATTFRRSIANYEQVKANIRRQTKDTVRGLEDRKKALKARYEADMAELSESIASVKAQATEDVKHAETIIAMSKAALKAAPAE